MKVMDIEVLRKYGWKLAKVKLDKNGVVEEFMTVELDDGPVVDLDQIKREWAREIFDEVEKCVIGTIEPSFIQCRDKYLYN